MNKKIMAFAALLILSVPVFAIGIGQGNGVYVSDELHLAIENAIETGNYQEWLNLREENNLPVRGIMSAMTEENFHLFSEMYNARENGDLETVQAIRAELGFGQGSRGMGGQGKRKGTGTSLRGA